MKLRTASLPQMTTQNQAHKREQFFTMVGDVGMNKFARVTIWHNIE